MLKVISIQSRTRRLRVVRFMVPIKGSKHRIYEKSEDDSKFTSQVIRGFTSHSVVNVIGILRFTPFGHINENGILLLFTYLQNMFTKFIIKFI